MSADTTPGARLVELLARRTLSGEQLAETPLEHWAILRHLARRGADGYAISQVATYLGTSLADTTRTIGELERKGLVAAADAQGRVALSDDGKQLAALDPVAHLDRAIARLSSEDQLQLNQLLERILDALDPPSGRA